MSIRKWIGNRIAKVGAFVMALGLRAAGWNWVQMQWIGEYRPEQGGEILTLPKVQYALFRAREAMVPTLVLVDSPSAVAMRIEAGRAIRAILGPAAGGCYIVMELLDGEPGRAVLIEDSDETWTAVAPLFPLEASAA